MENVLKKELESLGKVEVCTFVWGEMQRVNKNLKKKCLYIVFKLCKNKEMYGVVQIHSRKVFPIKNRSDD